MFSRYRYNRCLLAVLSVVYDGCVITQLIGVGASDTAIHAPMCTCVRATRVLFELCEYTFSPKIPGFAEVNCGVHLCCGLSMLL